MKRLVFVLTFIISSAILAFAQQRPLLTEDVDTTPEGAVRVSVGVDFLQDVKYPLSGLKGDQTSVGDIRISVGFSKNVEFQVEGTIQNFVAINSMSDPAPIPLDVTGNSTNDTGDFTVSTKIRLRNETERLPALGLKVGFQMPNTNQARGIGTNQINIFGKILAQKKFGSRNKANVPRLNLFGNLGLGIMSAPLERFTQNDVLLYGFAGIYRFNDRVNFVSEVNGRVSTRSGNAPLGTESIGQFRVGTQIRASGLKFDTAAIFGLTKYSPKTGITFGVTYESPSIFTPAQ